MCQLVPPRRSHGRLVRDLVALEIVLALFEDEDRCPAPGKLDRLFGRLVDKAMC